MQETVRKYLQCQVFVCGVNSFNYGVLQCVAVLRCVEIGCSVPCRKLFANIFRVRRVCVV